MHWPQYTYLAITLFALGISVSEHGKPKTGKESFWTFAIGNVIGLSLLYFGGFFSH